MKKKELTSLTQDLRREGLTPENRQRIRSIHAALNQKPAAATAPADQSAAKTADQSAAASARSRMIERQKNPGPVPGMNPHHYDRTIDPRNLAVETLPKGDYRK